MTTYYIDYNRGSDANAGTSSAAAWKNISKLSGTFADGDSVVLDDESTWSVTDRAVIGTIGNNFTLTRSRTNGTQLPTISFKLTITAGQWTYDAPNNGWYYDLGYTPGVMSWIRLGGRYYAQKQVAALPLGSVDYAWRESTNRVYLYAPSGQDPTTYYGSVEIGPSDRGAITFSSDGTNVVIDGLRFTEGGTGLNIYASSGTRLYTVRNCQTYDNTTLLFGTADTAGDVRYVVEGNTCRVAPSAFIQLYNSGGSGMGFSEIRYNNLQTCNLGYPQGAIYLQNRKGTAVYGNTISDARFGNAYQTVDGSAIYAEVGSDQTKVWGNTITNCHLALQDNSGRYSEWQGNLIVDCYAAMKVGDASAVGSTQHRFIGNTMVNLGTPVATLGAAAVATIGWRMVDVGSDDFIVANNIFTKVSSSSDTQPAIETPVSAAAGSAITNNCVYNFSSVAAAFDGSAASPTPTGSVTTDPQLDASYKPKNSSLVSGGSAVANIVLRDFYAKQVSGTPNIGAMYQYANRSTSTRSIASRSIASSRTALIKRAA